MEDKIISRLSHIVSTTVWGIDYNYGIQYLSKFMHDIELAESGIKIDLADERDESILKILGPSSSYLQEVSRKEAESISPGSIAKLVLSGALRLNDGLSSLGTKSLEKEIAYAKSNPNIDGLLVVVSSGGGEAIAGNHLYNMLSSFGKPVVSAIHYAGSAAYKAIVSSNEIIALGELAEAGSIGTLFSIDKNMLEFFKENFIDIYSDLSPQKNKAFRSLLQGDTSDIKKELNEVAEIFQKVVIKNRELNPDSKLTKDTLEGDMFLANEAKRRGLVDQVGNMDLAVNRLRSYINYKKK